MATLGHIAVGLAAARWDASQARPTFRSRFVSSTFYAALSLAPDLDVVARDLGVAHEHVLAHRGASHSLAAAFACALVIALLARWKHEPWQRIGALSFVVIASHGLLDALWPLRQRALTDTTSRRSS